ncbi:WG repeat-containing protein [Pedobacter gandavensis]|uniref:WG repeat-containing protein n=1 Tax=Pedobacter gandavensis TaxID=2679963 RepID=UPI00292D2333|nr:WG repeat-containing protein [Pedobacter gandavensis]
MKNNSKSFLKFATCCCFMVMTLNTYAQKPKNDKIIGYRMSRITGKMEFFNSNKEIVAAYPFSNITLDEHEVGFLAVGTSTKRGLMSDRGVMVVDTIYDFLAVVDKELALVFQGEKSGLIDFKGNIVVPIIYDNIDHFKANGRFTVEKDGKRGIVNRKGEFIEPLIPVHK